MPVRFPDMRRNGWEALAGIERNLGSDDYYGSLDNAVNVAADSFDPPGKCLGVSLINEEEVDALVAVWSAWEDVVREVGSRLEPSD